MTVIDLMRELAALGARLSTRGVRLNVDTPRGAVSSELKWELRAKKNEVMRLVQNYEQTIEAQPDCWSCGVPRQNDYATCKNCRAMTPGLTEEEVDEIIYGPGKWA